MGGARGGAAFEWGCTGNFVRGVTYDLSNTSKSELHGVLDAVNDRRNQRFENNCVVARTTGAPSTIERLRAPWFTDTALTGFLVINNQFERCSCGAQSNNQASMEPSAKPRGVLLNVNYPRSRR